MINYHLHSTHNSSLVGTIIFQRYFNVFIATTFIIGCIEKFQTSSFNLCCRYESVSGLGGGLNLFVDLNSFLMYRWQPTLTSTTSYQLIGLESGGKMTFCQSGLKPVDVPNTQIVMIPIVWHVFVCKNILFL
jgi:hypothetical protein